MSWLQHVTETIAADCGVDAADLELTQSDIRELLDVARIASHASGERTNAPLLCYVLGVARGRGAMLGDLTRAARTAASDTPV